MIRWLQNPNCLQKYSSLHSSRCLSIVRARRGESELQPGSGRTFKRHLHCTTFWSSHPACHGLDCPPPRAAYCMVQVPSACQPVLFPSAISRPATYKTRFPAKLPLNAMFSSRVMVFPEYFTLEPAVL